ncbi:MAG: four helix bundle protein [Patescibacteria group bacterium]
MIQISNNKQYDLEDRTLKFSKSVIEFTKHLPRTIENIEIIKQLIRAVCSVGANYIEANEALSKKDFLMRIKISKKEAKESIYWLNLIIVNNDADRNLRIKLINEATELMKILGSILEKSK